jgi:hypothetical protein
MWGVTGWALATWLRITLYLGVGVGVCWLVFGASSAWFVLACIVAVLADLFAARQLSREWCWNAAGTWWWTR